MTVYKAVWGDFLMGVAAIHFAPLVCSKRERETSDRINQLAEVLLKEIEARGCDWAENRPHVEHIARLMADKRMSLQMRRAVRDHLWKLLEMFSPLPEGVY